MNTFIVRIDRIVAWFCILLMCSLVSSVTWQVISRRILHSPSTFTDELARFLFIWLGLIGAAYTFGQKRHLAITLLQEKLNLNSALNATKLDLFVNMICLCFSCFILIFGGCFLVYRTLQTGQVSPALGWQMGWVYLALPFSGCLISIYGIDDLGNNLSKLKNYTEGV